MSFIYFSNNLTWLAKQLGHRLFDNTAQPFSKRTVLVPSDRYKRFLQEMFAKDPSLGIAMGVQILTLPTWSASRLAEKSGKTLLSYALLEARLFTLMQTLCLEPLQHLSDLQCKTLCQELAHLFHKYGAQGDMFLKPWLQREGWQQTLWKAIYENSHWGYSTETFQWPMQSEDPPHLFGFSSLASPHAQFFKNSGAIFYLFSPCPLFWSDLKTVKELARDGLIEDNPSLLAAFGKWGRRLLNELAAEEMESEEGYVEPDPSHSLGLLQKSIFDLEPQQASACLPDTIKAFSAKHRRQEVEELLEEILRILQRDKILTPADILVLSPDLDAYIPHIHAAFQNMAGIVDYAIRGMQRGHNSSLAQGVDALFALVEEKWSSEALLSLFSHSLFAAKRRWNKADLHLIEKWLKGAGMTWGFDHAQREASLDSQLGIAENGTLCFAFDRLLFGLSSTASKEGPTPCPQVHWPETELLNAFLETAEQMACDLADMVHNRKKPLKEWLAALLSLIDRYFVKEDDLWITDELQLLKKECQTWEEVLFTWKDLKKLCQELFTKQTSGYRTNNLETVQFDFLEEGNILPRKVIMLCGVQDGAFPRSEAETSLDQLEPKAPSKGEIDRFLFLESLLKAKELFVMSFLHTCPEKRIELPPSLVVQELQSALERCGTKLEIQILPEKDYTVDALSREHYFSASRFQAAQAFYSQGISKKEHARFFLRDWQERAVFSTPVLEEEEIDIADLQSLLRDPMEFFFKKGLALPLSWVDESVFYLEEICIQTAAKKHLIERTLRSSWDAAIDEYRKEKGLPFGVLQEIALNDLSDEICEITAQFQHHGIDVQQLQDVTLGKEIAPWQIELGEGKIVTLHGTVKNVGKEGLVDFQKEFSVKENWLKRWCDLLIVKGHPELHQIPDRLIVPMAKKNPERQYDSIDPLLEMRKLLHYYAIAKKHLSPLLPNWAEKLIECDLAGLEKEFQDPFQTRYVKWLFKRDGVPDPAVVCANWSACLQTTFSSVFKC